MVKIKDDSLYVSKALTDINAIIKYSSNKTYEEFMMDDELIDAVMFRLIQLVENIKGLSDEFKQNYQNIPWHKIIGFRNRIVHEYGETDYTAVYEIISRNIPVLKEVFESSYIK